MKKKVLLYTFLETCHQCWWIKRHIYIYEKNSRSYSRSPSRVSRKKYLAPFHMGKKVLAPSLGGERYNRLPQESPPPGRKLLDFPKTFVQIKVWNISIVMFSLPWQIYHYAKRNEIPMCNVSPVKIVYIICPIFILWVLMRHCSLIALIWAVRV